MSYNYKKEIKLDFSDKDILISQLKAQVFELDQNQKFRNQQNEYISLNFQFQYSK